ncbi:hypothetical protein [Actinoplanes sp. NPDC049316]|uniref:hypothetical protein n=1 Tax=Actinoplanes sp. NPDC049316 TaxID=3154727 RepID=UPI003449938E
MTDTTERGKGAWVRTAVRLLFAPALVGAVAAACTVPVVQSLSTADCVPDPDDQFACLGDALGSLAGIAFLLAVVTAVCWVVLALIIGSWRAPAVTMFGGMIAATAVFVLRSYVDLTADAATGWSVATTAVSFAGVSAVLLPRLPTVARILLGGLLMTVVVWAFVIRF